jgi:hypothetical protein
VPLGFIFVQEPADTGKTTFLSFSLHAAKKKVVLVVPTNTAATNIVTRAQGVDKHGRVLTRVWAEPSKEEAVLGYDLAEYDAWKTNKTNIFGRHERWEPRLSNAEWLLKALGLIPGATNPKIISFMDGGYYDDLRKIFGNSNCRCPLALRMGGKR